jgi:O-antigen/teichoic acid export membrane protein
VGVLTIPASMGITLQGTSIVIGALIGPAAVAVFSSVRTLSRFALQIASMVVRAIVPELAGAHGRGDAAATRRYWALFERARWLILVPAAIAFALLGSWLIELWSLGRLDAPPVLAVVMGLALLPHGSWFLDFFMLSATHNHVAVARPIMMWSLLGLGLVVLATSALGLLGAALATLAVDLVLAWRVRRAARALWTASAETHSIG